ncbi:MAG: hypothetical protein ACSHWU_08765 [Marinicella sp.]
MFNYSRMGFVISLFIGMSACQSVDKSDQQHKSTVEVAQLQSDSNEAINHYVPFPEGYGYMQNLPQLQAATDAGDSIIIRQHAWGLWAGIMQPDEQSGWPLWYSWPNTHGAFSLNTDDLSINKKGTKTVKKSTAKVQKHGTSLKQINQNNLNSAHAPPVDTPAPTYPIPAAITQNYPDAICHDHSGNPTICDGTNFVNNGDIMIATESLSLEAMNDIRQNKLYLKSTLNQAHTAGETMLDVTDRFIVTKHMYWPVKANGVTAIPVWKDNYPDSFTGYAGYEFWDTLVAIEPNNRQSIGQIVQGEFLYQVYDHSGTHLLPSVSEKALVYDINDFYHHQVTASDWANFDEADKAIINAASIWANNTRFAVGDYLVSIAMHVNTKELESWTLQSVWWSDAPNQGVYAANRPVLPQAKGPWQHYLLTDAYAVPAVNGLLAKAVNPYIEGVIHPIATNCRNCHVRAGWPQSQASYQNPTCPNLLLDLTPQSACLTGITLSDYLWIIPDRAQ